jgi:extracellular matrix protein 14
MNSNWGYQWSPSLFSNPCSESYPGAHAFEAVETQVVAEYLKNTPNDVRAFVDVHSYGQLCTSGAPSKGIVKADCSG